MRSKRGHQNARASGKSSSAAKCFSPSAMQFVHRVGRQAVGETLGEIADGGVDDGAAVGGAGRGVDRVERLQSENMLGVDGVGIAQPVLDLGDRKARRPRRARRLRRRLRRRFAVLRPIERARPGEISLAALERRLASARRRRRRGAARSATAPSARRRSWRRGVRITSRAPSSLREIVRGEADAALRQIEAELQAASGG